MCLFCHAVMNILERKKDVTSELIEKFPTTFAASCCFWPAAQVSIITSYPSCMVQKLSLNTMADLKLWVWVFCSYSVTRHMCCDLAGSVGSQRHWLWDITRKRNEFLLLCIVLRILQLLITLEPLDQCKWGFQENVPRLVRTSIK